jgi:Xaa-Pro aminopeptidase
MGDNASLKCVEGGTTQQHLIGEHLVPRSTFPYAAADLDRFRQVQRVAYDIALRVESQLQAGITEAEACTLIAAAQAEHEVIQVFHRPYAWFGSHTVPGYEDGLAGAGAGTGTDGASTSAVDLAATGVEPSASMFPTDQRLVDGDSVILDLAPVAHGVASDVAYSCAFGHNDVFAELDAGLARIRTTILEGIRAGGSMLMLYHELDEQLAEHGWISCYHRYADRALGHLVFPLGHDPERSSPLPGWGTAAAEQMLAAGIEALDHGTCYPLWNDSAFTDYPATPGLWAIEPHIGRDGTGVKFEELLVVTGDDAYWLDDHLPHTQRWAAAGYSAAPLGGGRPRA